MNTFLKKSLRLRPFVRLSHALAIPYNHQPITKFEKGVPKDMVRPLVDPNEKEWEFWSSSDAFMTRCRPSFFGLSHIPFGETWVFTNKKFLNAGIHFIPLFTKLQTVKTPHPVIMGIVTDETSTKDGQNVNGYVVCTIKVTDPVKSAFYVDPETNKLDSERVLARLLRKSLENEINSFQGKDFDAKTKAILNQKLTEAVTPFESEFGLQVMNVDVRGAFPASFDLKAKLRAMSPPVFTGTGHNLSNDYWADRLTPPFFEKNRFGSEKQIKTPAAVSLEWCIPSPPDFHHFNQLPRMTAAVEETKK